MDEETVTVGDTEVTITETDDGFEVEPVEDEPEGLYLRATADGESYGFEIPLGGPYEIEKRDMSTYNYKAAWDESADISDMSSGCHNGLGGTELDGHANIKDVEIVER